MSGCVCIYICMQKAEEIYWKIKSKKKTKKTFNLKNQKGTFKDLGS